MLVMDPQAIIREYFEHIGLSQESSLIYLTLVANGPLTLSELSRQSGIERTRVYRLLDDATLKQLVTSDQNAKKSLFRAAPLSNLHHVLDSRIQTIKQLKDNLVLIENSLGDRKIFTPTDEITTYSQVDGLRQSWWQLLDSQSLILGYQDPKVYATLGKTFWDDWSRQFQNRRLQAKIFVSNMDPILQAPRIRGLKYHTLTSTALILDHSAVAFDDNVTVVSWYRDQVSTVAHRNNAYVQSLKTLMSNL